MVFHYLGLPTQAGLIGPRSLGRLPDFKNRLISAGLNVPSDRWEKAGAFQASGPNQAAWEAFANPYFCR